MGDFCQAFLLPGMNMKLNTFSFIKPNLTISKNISDHTITCHRQNEDLPCEQAQSFAHQLGRLRVVLEPDVLVAIRLLLHKLFNAHSVLVIFVIPLDLKCTSDMSSLYGYITLLYCQLFSNSGKPVSNLDTLFRRTLLLLHPRSHPPVNMKCQALSLVSFETSSK